MKQIKLFLTELIETLRLIKSQLEQIATTQRIHDDRLNVMGNFIISSANLDCDTIISISDGDTECAMTVDNRSSRPLVVADGVKLLFVSKTGLNKTRYTHLDALTTHEFVEFKKYGCVVIRNE